MKKILVTGCTGQLGRAINKEYAGSGAELVNTDVQAAEGVLALDITSIEDVLGLVRQVQPDVIINCAAHTAVDLCEQQWDKAYRIKAIGTRKLSNAAAEVIAKMIHVTHDFVFDSHGTLHSTVFVLL